MVRTVWCVVKPIGVPAAIAAAIAFGHGPMLAAVPLTTTSEYVYVTHRIFGPSFVSALRVDPTTGSLSNVAGSPFPTAVFTWDVKVDPRNRYLYATDTQTADISAFAISPASGALTPIPGSPFPFGFDPRSLAIHPSGRFLYASEIDFELPARRIDPVTGGLSQLPGAPFPGPSLSSGIAIHPNGRFLYLAEGQNSTGGFDSTIWTYALDPQTGTLAQIGIPVPSGTRTREIAIDAAGRFLYTVNADSVDIRAFAIDAGSGLLTPIAGSPFAAIPDVRTLAIGGRRFVGHQATGQDFLYVVSKSGSSVLAFVRDLETGALTPVPGSPFAVPAAPEDVVLDCTGRFAYVSHGDPVNAVSTLRIDPSSGAVAPVPGSPFPLGAPTALSIATTSFSCGSRQTPIR